MTSPYDADDVLSRVSHLVRAERSALAALARTEGVGPEDAVDCVQEALCTLLTSAQKGDLAAPPEEWGALLAGMVRNAARNRRRRHFLSRPHVALDTYELAAGDAPKADDLLAHAEEHIRLRACVQELCDVQRAVITLRMLEERPGEDVARVLGISSGHVAVLLHRAKVALRACMTNVAT